MIEFFLTMSALDLVYFGIICNVLILPFSFILVIITSIGEAYRNPTGVTELTELTELTRVLREYKETKEYIPGRNFLRFIVNYGFPFLNCYIRCYFWIIFIFTRGTFSDKIFNAFLGTEKSQIIRIYKDV